MSARENTSFSVEYNMSLNQTYIIIIIIIINRLHRQHDRTPRKQLCLEQPPASNFHVVNKTNSNATPVGVEGEMEADQS